MVIISAAVEGSIDEVLVRRLVDAAGGVVGRVYGKSGKQALRSKIDGYNNAAKHAPWIVLVDLDQEACAPDLRRNWLPAPASKMCFRVAVREAEAWLLADRERLADFLSVPLSKISTNPETLPNPKQTMVQLAQLSRRSQVRNDMVPRPGSGRSVGPAYTSRLMEFIGIGDGQWRPGVAAQHSDSLKRSLKSLRRLVRESRP